MQVLACPATLYAPAGARRVFSARRLHRLGLHRRPHPQALDGARRGRPGSNAAPQAWRPMDGADLHVLWHVHIGYLTALGFIVPCLVMR